MAEASAGTLLREARERQGLHIAALAAAIKVSPRKLDALEHDRLEELPDATFARALAQTVCRTLKIDARPVLERLPTSTSTLETAGYGLNMPFQQHGGRADGLAFAAIRPMVLAASLLTSESASYSERTGGRSNSPSNFGETSAKRSSRVSTPMASSISRMSSSVCGVKRATRLYPLVG